MGVGADVRLVIGRLLANPMSPTCMCTMRCTAAIQPASTAPEFMLSRQIVRRTHLVEATGGAFELEGAVARDVERVRLCAGGDHQLGLRFRRAHRSASRSAPPRSARRPLRHAVEQDGRIVAREGQVVGGAEWLLAELVERSATPTACR